MQVTILFGNGLDLGYGLNTSYFKFYEYLIGQEENNEILRNNIIFKRLKEDKDNEKNSLSRGFVSASLLYCVGAMAVVGAIQSGLSSDYSTLFAKSILDGVSSIFFAASLVIGVILSSAAVFLY